MPLLSYRRHRRSDREAGNQLGSWLVVAQVRPVRSGGRQRRESRYPGTDLMRRVAALGGDERVGPLVEVVEMSTVHDLEELAIELRVEGRKVARSRGEALGCVHHGGLPRRSLLGGH